MSAYFDAGFSVRVPSWHGQALVLDDYPESWEAARKLAGLEWDPIERPMFTRTTISAGDVTNDMIIVSRDDVFADVMVPTEGFKAMTRSDTGAVLGAVSESYSVITNGQMGEIAEGVLDVDSAVKYETAGSLMGGRKVWALLRLDEPISIKGDSSDVHPFLAITNAHDGGGSCKAIITYVRIICWNTWQLAETSEMQVSIRHTGNIGERIEDAKAMLARARAGSKAYAIAAEELISINVSDGLVRTFLDDFIPIPEGASERTRVARSERQATFMKLYESSPTTDGIRGTAYGLTQAMGEYLDHIRPFQTPDTYLSRTMLRPEKIKAQAMRAVCELIERPDLLVLAGSRN